MVEKDTKKDLTYLVIILSAIGIVAAAAYFVNTIINSEPEVIPPAPVDPNPEPNQTNPDPEPVEPNPDNNNTNPDPQPNQTNPEPDYFEQVCNIEPKAEVCILPLNGTNQTTG